MSASYVCVETYRFFIFKSIVDNIQYFAIFFSMAAYFSTKFVYLSVTSAEAGLWFSIPLLGLTFHLGLAIIKEKMYDMRYIDMNKISHPRVMAHYLQIVER